MADFKRWLDRFPDAIFRWLIRTPDVASDHPGCVAWGLTWGGILGIALILSVFIGGQTFGQRCAVTFDKGTADWSACVRRLSEGGRVSE